MNMELLAQFSGLRAQKRDLESQLKAVNQEIETLQPLALEEFMENNVTNMKVNGETLFIYRQVWAGSVQVEGPDGKMHGDKERTTKALIAAGLGWMVEPSFNAQVLSGWIREQPTDDSGNPILPPELEGNVSISPKAEIRLRAATRSRSRENASDEE